MDNIEDNAVKIEGDKLFLLWNCRDGSNIILKGCDYVNHFIENREMDCWDYTAVEIEFGKNSNDCKDANVYDICMEITQLIENIQRGK
jgi:hypothetical protein